MTTVDDIIGFLKQFAVGERIFPDSDLFFEHGITGDDFHEMMQKYSVNYSVDMTDYLWYFHTDEEGGWSSIGAAFFRPPYARVKRIPVTPALLARFANEKKWRIDYPEHTIQGKRYDLLINGIVVVIFILVAVIISLSSF